MDSVSKLTRLLEALRLQQTGSKRTSKTTATTDTQRSAVQIESNGDLHKKPSLDQLSRSISERIGRLPPEDREGDKGTQIFIDSVLAWEFGEELLQSDSFLKYSKQIREAIHSNSKLNHDLNHLIKTLLEVNDYR